MTLSTLTASQSNTEPRLKPIENPKSLRLKLAYWFAKRRVGKVVTPIKVHSARFLEGLGLSKKIMETKEKITIDPKLNHLIKVSSVRLRVKEPQLVTGLGVILRERLAGK